MLQRRCLKGRLTRWRSRAGPSVVRVRGSAPDLRWGRARVTLWPCAGGGHAIIRVDVSSDGGKTWTTADLHPAAGKAGQLHRCACERAPPAAVLAWPCPQARCAACRQYAWTQWEATVPVAPGSTGRVELCCKATDASYNTQPESYEQAWNLRGVICNAWNRVQLSVSD